ncbi:MAG TPA: glycosyltransferase family 2 protein [Thermoanaerobaculia bacterium]|nr:glycosyltransferase family 2 protein [Thermoanaerobaculia bacterium]
MSIFGTLVVQNENDIIDELLGYLRELAFFDAIFLYDLGSDDGTFERALRHRDILHDPQVVAEPYSETLRHRLMLSRRDHYRPGDWMVMIDADEFYEDDPRPIVRLAELEGADCIFAWQAEFMFTDLDLARFAEEDETLPIRERRRHYLIDWTEPRFYRYHGAWQNDPRKAYHCSERILNRHYQYRTPGQIQKRIDTRRRARERTEGRPDQFKWLQIFSDRWEDYVISHELCHLDDGTGLKFGFPPGVTLEDYRRSPYPHDMGGMMLKCDTWRRQTEESGAPMTIVRLGVEGTSAGVAFNPQPSGESAFWLLAENARPGTVVVMDSVPLVTAVGEEGVVTAVVPEALYQRPGSREVHLRHRERRSNALEFVVS